MVKEKLMDSPHTQIVHEMIEQLRLLQGTGDYVPPARRVIAGAGLTGGGSLAEDRTIALSEDNLAQIEKVRTSTWVESSTVSAAPSGSTIPMRDSSGRLKAASPSANNDVATLATVEGATARVVRSVQGDAPLQVAVRSLDSHDESTEVNGVLYILVE